MSEEDRYLVQSRTDTHRSNSVSPLPNNPINEKSWDLTSNQNAQYVDDQFVTPPQGLSLDEICWRHDLLRESRLNSPPNQATTQPIYDGTSPSFGPNHPFSTPISDPLSFPSFQDNDFQYGPDTYQGDYSSPSAVYSGFTGHPIHQGGSNVLQEPDVNAWTGQTSHSGEIIPSGSFNDILPWQPELSLGAEQYMVHSNVGPGGSHVTRLSPFNTAINGSNPCKKAIYTHGFVDKRGKLFGPSDRRSCSECEAYFEWKDLPQEVQGEGLGTAESSVKVRDNF
ncbi:uncharacterized protein IL334_000820 [Kwoniella shivajii]|uniref:Uncharacterized protein n=1 Tax=Kwoniella shivajii TaxID=564305 RepID=A0ABZ1CQ88_9TREE|nr:hypothetical protein IL334_000820 [Kwoniella shivajii]